MGWDILLCMSAKTVLLLILLPCLAVFLYACGECSQRIDCPGFADDTLTRLFPYSDNQMLVFRSDTNSTETFTLKNTRTTEPYQATGGGYGAPPRCSEEKVFESNERDTGSRRTWFYVHLQSGDYQTVDMVINTTSIYFNNFSDTAFATVSLGGLQAPPLFRPLVTVGNRTFNNAVVAQRDTANVKRSGIYRIFYTRAEGIVGYTDYPSGINWVKQ